MLAHVFLKEIIRFCWRQDLFQEVFIGVCFLNDGQLSHKLPIGLLVLITTK